MTESLTPEDAVRAQLEAYAGDFGRLVTAYQALQLKFDNMRLARALEQDQEAIRPLPAKGDDPRRPEATIALLQVLDDSEPLHLAYQPMIEAGSGRILGFEVLLRLRHSRFGAFSNELGIALAEEYGMIQDLDMKVLRHACRQAGAWHARGLSTRIAVNISVQSLAMPGIADAIAATLIEEELPASLLELEITETVAHPQAQGIDETLKALRWLGLSLAMDDFGTGHSNLARLRDLPFRRLKIDRRFIRCMTLTQHDMRLVESVLAMAQALGLATVAEGVEHLDQLNALCRLGCDEIQGHLYSPAVDAAAAKAMLRREILSPCINV